MKVNSDASMKTAAEVFHAYGGSWTAAREAGRRDANGVLVIPRRPPTPPTNVNESQPQARRTAG